MTNAEHKQEHEHKKAAMGIAGRLSKIFIRSKLTPLMVLASLALGVFAVLKLPREEEPQINVPLFDIMVRYPGAGAKEVEKRIVDVGERKLWELPGVTYIYSTAQSGGALFIVRFKVGTSPEKAMTLLFTKVFSNIDWLPPGAPLPLVKPRSIDDVPILALTLWGKGLDGYALRRQAADIRREISAVRDISRIEIIGGRRRRFLVHLDPDKLARQHLPPLDLAHIIQGANTRLPAGHLNDGSRTVLVDADSFIRSAKDLSALVVGVFGGRPVRLGSVAEVTDGPDEEEREVWTQRAGGEAGVTSVPYPAVTLAVSKRRGANATTVADAVLERLGSIRRTLDSRLNVSVTRNYGKTAKEKSDELLYHMLLATISVTLLIAFALGFQESLVVLIAVPVTLALTLLVYYLAGYTLNRITLFALIFSIGILVDDAIVVVENIHRHFSMGDGRTLWALAVDAVDEVGNPTLLATWTVIAAILPMAFVGGLMGPYMRPIPVGASFAMFFSVVVAFVVSPWAFAHVLELAKPRACAETGSHGGRLDRLYRKAMRTLLEKGRARALFLLGNALLLAGALALVAYRYVAVKMLPFDNKDEFEVVLNMPESASLEATKKASSEMAEALKRIPEARRVSVYAGVAAPYNFNGLVRHYFLRDSPSQSDIVVNLAPRGERKRQSHEIAREFRPRLARIARKYEARVQLAEVPPGPPVLSTLVFEIYGPDADVRRETARRLKEVLEKSPGITDVDTYVSGPRPLERLAVDAAKATLNGIPPDAVARTAAMALGGMTVGLAHAEGEKEPVEIRLRLPERMRRDLSALKRLPFFSPTGREIPLGSLVRPARLTEEFPIYHKNLREVSYVIADVAGRQESPVYAILNLRDKVAALSRAMGAKLAPYYVGYPDNSLESAIKWDGEWQITYEVFRDLGFAFAAVLILIYFLVVSWFKSFSIPLVIMAPIPLTLVGILPAHWLAGAFFTATSMIGFIAGAGIVVRNSIILVDFIELRRREGMPLKEAVIDAGAVRLRPILLTAAAVVAGAAVVFFDPIFQGLAISLSAGEVAATILSLPAVPVLYYMREKMRKRERQLHLHEH